MRLSIAMKTLPFLLIVLFSNGSIAQESRLLNGPSADQQRIAMDAAFAWRDSKKLSLVEPVPDLPQPRQGDSIDPDQFQQGQIGRLSYWQFKVADIVDDKNMVLSLGTNYRIWVEGYPTAGLVDNQAVRIIDFVEIKETKSYETVTGGKTTVWVVRPISKEENEKRATEGLNRVWLGKNGETTTGKFLELKNSKISLEQHDGRKITFPVSSLATEDRELAMKLGKEKKKK